MSSAAHTQNTENVETAALLKLHAVTTSHITQKLHGHKIIYSKLNKTKHKPANSSLCCFYIIADCVCSQSLTNDIHIPPVVNITVRQESFLETYLTPLTSDHLCFSPHHWLHHLTMITCAFPSALCKQPHPCCLCLNHPALISKDVQPIKTSYLSKVVPCLLRAMLTTKQC